MGEYGNLDPAFAGLLYGSYTRRVESWLAGEDINYGDPVFSYAGEDFSEGDGTVWKAKRDLSIILWDGNFVISNSIDVIINGTTVTTPFNFDQATTMADIVSNIEAEVALAGITAERTDISGNDRTLQLIWRGNNIIVTESVTGGASQATGAITYSTAQIFIGIAIHTHKSHVNSVGFYIAGEMMNAITEGWIWVNSDGAINSNTDAYVIWMLTTDQGKFTAAATDNYSTRCRFRNTITSAGLALVQVHNQNTDVTP